VLSAHEPITSKDEFNEQMHEYNAKKWNSYICVHKCACTTGHCGEDEEGYQIIDEKRESAHFPLLPSQSKMNTSVPSSSSGPGSVSLGAVASRRTDGPLAAVVRSYEEKEFMSVSIHAPKKKWKE